MLVLEIKAMAGVIHDPNQIAAKNAAAAKWVEAVNNVKEYLQWRFVYCDDPSRLRSMILEHAPTATADALPFHSVTPRASEHFETCVPLTSLRAAAGRFGKRQNELDELGTWATEWITWDKHPRFEPGSGGMFIGTTLRR